MVSIRSRWQGRHGAWLIDTPPQMVSLTTDSPQRNATVITIAWPSVSESVLQVRLGVTVFCILVLPRVTLGITAKEVNTITHESAYGVVIQQKSHNGHSIRQKEMEMNSQSH